MTDFSARNVLWITMDEFRPDCLGVAGNELIQTPHLDALAREGVLMRNAFCQASPCAPSRMSMFTGRYMCSTGVVDNMTPLAEAEDNIAAHLRRHGYAPVILGYNDYARDPRILPEGHPHRNSLSYEYFLPGFDVALKHEYDSDEWYAWLGEHGYPAHMLNRETMYAHCVPEGGPGAHLPLHYPAPYRAEHSEAQFLTGKAIECLQRQAGRSWVVSVNYLKPHGPYICPEPYHAMYNPSEMPPPVRTDEEAANNHPYISRCRNDWAQTELQDERDWQELRACYYGMITELDACIGRLMGYLKDSGQWDNTLIVFGSDHGTYLGDHYLAGKPHFYDAAMRVPLIIRDPRPEAELTRGRQLEPCVENIDIAPTVCAYLGVPAHERFQGKSLVNMLHGQPVAAGGDEAFYEFYYYNLLRDPQDVNPEACRLWVIRDRRYKYVQFGEEHMPAQLFDIVADPGEHENLAQQPEHASTVAVYCQRLLRWRIRNEDNRMEQWARPYR